MNTSISKKKPVFFMARIYSVYLKSHDLTFVFKHSGSNDCNLLFKKLLSPFQF